MLNIIKSRRSIRNYENQIISKDDLKDLLTAAMYAPSAGNEQAWQFIILEGDILKEYLKINKNVPQSAPYGILVCIDKNLEKYKDMNTGVLDCSAAVENILLMAHSKGLGALWTAVFENVIDQIKKLLNLPDHIKPFAFIPIGYSKENKKDINDRYDEAKIHYNKW